MSDPDLLAAIREIRSSQKRLEQAVIGDPDIGVTGVVKRLGTVEGKVKNIEKERVKLAGIIIGASGVISVVGGAVSWLLSHAR